MCFGQNTYIMFKRGGVKTMFYGISRRIVFRFLFFFFLTDIKFSATTTSDVEKKILLPRNTSFFFIKTLSAKNYDDVDGGRRVKKFLKFFLFTMKYNFERILLVYFHPCQRRGIIFLNSFSYKFAVGYWTG